MASLHVLAPALISTTLGQVTTDDGTLKLSSASDRYARTAIREIRR
jgi:hypothetical protein